MISLNSNSKAICFDQTFGRLKASVLYKKIKNVVAVALYG